MHGGNQRGLAAVDERVYDALNSVEGLAGKVSPILAEGGNLELPCAVYRINGGSHERSFTGSKMTHARFEVIISDCDHRRLGVVSERVLARMTRKDIAASAQGPVDGFVEAPGLEVVTPDGAQPPLGGIMQRRWEFTVKL